MVQALPPQADEPHNLGAYVEQAIATLHSLGGGAPALPSEQPPLYAAAATPHVPVGVLESLVEQKVAEAVTRMQAGSLHPTTLPPLHSRNASAFTPATSLSSNPNQREHLPTLGLFTSPVSPAPPTHQQSTPYHHPPAQLPPEVLLALIDAIRQDIAHREINQTVEQKVTAALMQLVKQEYSQGPPPPPPPPPAPPSNQTN